MAIHEALTAVTGGRGSAGAARWECDETDADALALDLPQG